MTARNWSEIVDAWVLGALEPEEHAAFEARLAEDAELQAMVDAASAATLELAEALPDLDVPTSVKTDVMARIRGTSGGSGAAGGGSEGPPTGGPTAGGATQVTGATPTGTESVAPAEPSDAAGPTLRAVEGGRTAPAPGRPVQRAAPWLLLAASLAGLFYLGSENTEMSRETDRLTAELDGLRASLGDAETRLARFDSLALAISGPNVQMASLTGDADPSLRLVWNRDRELLLVAAQNLPTLQPGRTYQLWGIRGTDAPVSLGTFDTDAGGSALLTLGSVQSADFEVSAITDEPAGGSPGPTTTPFLVGAWSAVQ